MKLLFKIVLKYILYKLDDKYMFNIIKYVLIL